MSETPYTLAELLIAAASDAWRGDGEILATGITPIPRIAAALAKATYAPQLLMTDAEVYFTVDPVPPGKRHVPIEIEGWAPYDRTFSLLWSGKRHAMVAPVQIDRFGQTNISVIGNHAKPKSAMLGARGFPGNSIYHPNSFFFPTHTARGCVAGEVDFVCSAGYNRERFAGRPFPKGLDLRLIVTNLAVLNFGGPDHAMQVVSLHPGVAFEQVQENTGFPLHRPDTIGITPAPTAHQLHVIRTVIDPNNVRDSVIKPERAA